MNADGMSRGRVNPSDLDVDRRDGGRRDNGAHREADVDYVHNLKKFERHDDMAAEPTRKPSRDMERK